jgi:putative ABC transport system permease protein
MSLRAALGAGRFRLVRQLILESLILAAASACAGLLLAWVATTALVALRPRELPRIQDIHIDVQVLWFTLAASLVTVVLSGIMPALRTSRVDLTDSLRDLSRSTPGRSRHAIRSLLVTGELALAFLLVMGAGLLAKSLIRLTAVDLGYDPHNVLTLGVYVYGERYKKPEAELNLYSQVMDRLRATPGVESVAMASTLPLVGFDRRGFHIQDHRLANEAAAPFAETYSVSPDYFRVMRIPLKRGRLFTAADQTGTPRVALISESCARSQFPQQDAIGKHIQLGGRRDDKEWLTVVGIVGDVRHYGLDRAPGIDAYVAQAQDVNFGYSMVVRSTNDPQHLEKAVRATFLAVDPTQPVFHVRPLESYLADTLAARTFTLVLLGLFGALALALAAIGVYGLVSYTVSLRTGEVGIRMALGAGESDVLLLVLRDGAIMVSGGLAVGVCASLALTRFLATLLFEVQPTDATMSAAAALGLGVVALVAAYVPARRAARIDPMAALRIG